MVVVPLVAGAVVVLLVTGLWTVWTARSANAEDRREELLEETGDLIDPEEVDEMVRHQNEAERTLVLAVSEATILLIILGIGMIVVSRPPSVVPTGIKAVVAGCFGIGAALMVRVLVVRARNV